MAGRRDGLHGDPADFRPAAPDAETVIRTALNRRYGATHILDPDARRRELAERETLFRSLYHLHRISLEHTPPARRQPIRENEIERAATVFRRLSLVRQLTPESVIAFCETEAARDPYLETHVGDAFQLRHLSSFHPGLPPEQREALEIHHLVAACERRDDQALRDWFDRIARRKDGVPKDTMPLLKYVMLQQWRDGNLNLETFAFEQAVLDVRLFGVIGWENTRTFYAVLQRTGRKACATFDDFLNAADIDEAISLHETVENTEQLAHFCTLRTRFDPQRPAECERAVFAAAESRPQAPAETPTAAGPAGSSTHLRGPSFMRVFQSAPTPA